MPKSTFILVPLTLIVVLGHFGWFWLSGPPSRWGSGVSEKVPVFARGSWPSKPLEYCQEFAKPAARLSWKNIPGVTTARAIGREVYFDQEPTAGGRFCKPMPAGFGARISISTCETIPPRAGAN